MMKQHFWKLAGINLLVFICLLIPLECYFGSWFRPSRLNELNLITDYKTEINISGYYPYSTPRITYTRDHYGLRGTAFNQPGKIDLLTVGGSTTDQRYIDDTCTWQVLLEQELQQHNCNITIGNAGVDGHSTFAHLAAFDLWFPRIPDLKPKWIIYYIGINDFCIEANHERDQLVSSSWIQKSALYQLFRKLKRTFNAHRLGLTHKQINLAQVSYTRKGLVPLENYKQLVEPQAAAFVQRLELLATKTRAMGAEPVFVTQPTYFYRFTPQSLPEGTAEQLYYTTPINGVDYYHLKRLMDEACCTTAARLNVSCIDIGAGKDWTRDDFYDYVHLTPTGTHKLAAKLAAPLQHIICRDNLQEFK